MSDERKVGTPLRDAAADPRPGDARTSWPIGHNADGHPVPASPVPVTVDETGRVTGVDGEPPVAPTPEHVGGRLRDAAAADPADRPPIKPESAYPARIPRVPCTLVQTSTGPVWRYDWHGTRGARGYQPLPVTVHLRGRTVLLVEAEGSDA